MSGTNFLEEQAEKSGLIDYAKSLLPDNELDGLQDGWAILVTALCEVASQNAVTKKGKFLFTVISATKQTPVEVTVNIAHGENPKRAILRALLDTGGNLLTGAAVGLIFSGASGEGVGVAAVAVGYFAGKAVTDLIAEGCNSILGPDFSMVKKK